MKYLAVGTPVLVHIPAEDRQAHAPVYKFHDAEMVISKRTTLRHSNYVYYELEGAVQEYWGIPYGFVREWLIPL